MSMKPEVVALKPLVDFVMGADPTWFGRVDHGCPEEEVARFEATLGFPIPRAVREHFLLMGRTSTFLAVFDPEWCGRLDQAVEYNGRPVLNPDLGVGALYLGDDEINCGPYFVEPVSMDDPPLYREPHRHPLAERFSFALLWGAFGVLRVAPCPRVLSGFLARRVSPGRFAEIVGVVIASGFERAFDSGRDLPCLQRGQEFLRMHYSARGDVGEVWLYYGCGPAETVAARALIESLGETRDLRELTKQAPGGTERGVLAAAGPLRGGDAGSPATR